jgi:hypothetical protein
MALSGSFNYTVDAATVIQDALENLGIVGRGESVDSDDQTVCLRTLNLIAKQWSSPANQKPGMRVWLRRNVYLFPQKSQSIYNLGVGMTDKASETLNRTTLSAAEAIGQTVLSITSETGMSNGDVIGIVQDDGSTHWSTISSTSSGSVTIALALTVAAAAGNAVYWYTNAIAFRPMEVLSCSLRQYTNDSWQDIPLDVSTSLADYEAIPNKGLQGYPIFVLAEQFRLLQRLSFDVAFRDARYIARLVLTSPADDLDTTTDDLMFPVEMYAPLAWELALRIAPKFGAPWSETHKASYNNAMAIGDRINMPGSIGGFNPQPLDDESDRYNI